MGERGWEEQRDSLDLKLNAPTINLLCRIFQTIPPMTEEVQQRERRTETIRAALLDFSYNSVSVLSEYFFPPDASSLFSKHC